MWVSSGVNIRVGWGMQIVGFVYNSSDLGGIFKSKSSLCVNRHIG